MAKSARAPEAKIFMSGHSQAVRIPSQYRLPGTRVRISKSGDSLVLTPIVDSLDELWKKLDSLGTADFMAEGRDQPPMPPDKDLFG